MPSVWVAKRPHVKGGQPVPGKFHYRVMYRLRGHETAPRYAGQFRTKREASIRAEWVRNELAAMRVPDVSALVAPAPAPTLREKALAWQRWRTDVRDSTAVQHTTALGRVLPKLGSRFVDTITIDDVQALVSELEEKGYAYESVRKSKTALALVLDYARIEPNPARSKLVKLRNEETEEVEPPVADHVEAVGWLLSAAYLLGLLVLDATGCRIGELAAAKVGDLDEGRRAWLVRAKVSKTKRARWVTLPDDVYEAIVEQLPAKEDRDLAAPLVAIGSADRLRMAILRACRHAGVPEWSPHELRHRRISLLHHQGVSWAEIGARVGQRNLSVTADTYTHTLMDDYREIDRRKLLARVREGQTHRQTPERENGLFAGAF